VSPVVWTHAAAQLTQSATFVWAIFVSSFSLLESDYPMSAEQICQARNKLDRISRELTETNSESFVAPPPLWPDSAVVL
jgi:hypothetical protein